MVIETFYVPSESMLPSLLIGDHVFVSKFAYGARIPFTETQLPATREPERGDVVVFDLGKRPDGRICPRDECPGSRSESFVKRIVGVPGDMLERRGNAIYLNGAPLPVRFTDETFTDDQGRDYRVGREELAGREHALLDHPRLPGLPMKKLKVPPGRFFMLGDNRDASNDSRSWGTVPRVDLRGPVIRIYWSWNNQGSWLSMLNPWTWIRLLLYETRWNRFGDPVP